MSDRGWPPSAAPWLGVVIAAAVALSSVLVYAFTAPPAGNPTPLQGGMPGTRVPGGGAPPVPPLYFDSPYGFSEGPGSNSSTGCPAPFSGVSYCVGIPIQVGSGYFGTNDTTLSVTAADGTPEPFNMVTLVNGSGLGLAENSLSGDPGGWARCNVPTCWSVANGSWNLPLGFVTYDQFILWSGANDPSGWTLTFNRSSATGWEGGGGNAEWANATETWKPGQVTITLVGPGIGRAPPPPPVSLEDALNLAFVREENSSPAGHASVGCPAPPSGTNYCDVFAVSRALDGVSTEGLGLSWVQTPNASIRGFNVTIGNATGAGLAQYGNNTISNGWGWAVCTPSNCGSNLTWAGSLPVRLQPGDVFVVCVSGILPSAGFTVVLNGAGRFSGELTYTLP